MVDTENPDRPAAEPRAGAGTDVPTVTVLGNCQAQVYRDRLGELGRFRLPEVPLVHELVAADLDDLHAVLSRTDVAIMQPVVDDYRGLPVGYRQLAAAVPGGSTVIVVPVLRYAGLHPYTVVVRPPSDRSLVPPVVPYHDLRTLASVALDRPDLAHRVPDEQAVRAGHEESVQQLRTRERAHGTVVVSDLLEEHPRWHTINHPDRATLDHVVQRILDRFPAGIDTTLPTTSTREPLGALRAPVLPEVEDALGLERLGPRAWQTPDGELTEDTVRHAHRQWYLGHPDAVAEGMRRHADRLVLLGLA